MQNSQLIITDSPDEEDDFAENDSRIIENLKSIVDDSVFIVDKGAAQGRSNVV